MIVCHLEPHAVSNTIIMFSIPVMLSEEILVHDNRCRGNTISFNLISKTVL